MLRSYFTLAYRNLLKNRLASCINIVGLSLAIGASLLVFLLIDLQATKDDFHTLRDQIYLVGHTIEGSQALETWGSTPVSLGPALETDLPQVQRAVRVADGSGDVQVGDNVFRESLRFVDPGFLDLFTFPLKWGDPSALQDRQAVILNEALAEKYFGTENPVGRKLTITFNQTVTRDFTVGGVAARFPINASFTFPMLLPYDVQRDLGSTLDDDWGSTTRATFIQVPNQRDVGTILERMAPYLDRQHAARPDRPMHGLVLEPLPTLSDHAHRIRGCIAGGEVPSALFTLLAIGALLMTLACINYVNVALASATRRISEVGVRRAFGGHRRQLVVQFLGENTLICLLALLAGLLLAQFVFLPGLLSLTTGNLDVSLRDFFGKPHIWLFFLGVLLLTSVGAGIYPALYVSSFTPVSILRGQMKIGGKERFSQTLLAVQFAISFLAITLVITLWQNDRYQHNRDWGYNQEQVLGVSLDASDQYPILHDQVLQDPSILSLAGSAQHFGQSSRSSIIVVETRQHQVTRFDVGFNYLETMGVTLKAGRFFDAALSTDLDEALIVNETLVEAMGWDAPVGRAIRFGEQDYTIVGVVQDFHYWSFFSEIQPVIVRAVPETEFQYLIARTRPGQAVQTHDRLAQTWRGLFPNSPFFGFFQDAVFERAFRDNRTVMTLTGTSAIIALLLSCMGLFGLVTLMIAKRMRVLSIHKVLGATPAQVANLINRQFAVLLTIAIVVSTPLSYFILQAMLGSVYEYHVPVGLTAFVLGALAIFLIAALTIATRIYKAATANPVDMLRTS